MVEILSHRTILLMVAAFSRHEGALDWTKERAERKWGKVALESERFEHRETKYYEATMGTDLKKTFFAFERLVDPARFPEFKSHALRRAIKIVRSSGGLSPS